jgi:hypothetical protein
MQFTRRPPVYTRAPALCAATLLGLQLTLLASIATGKIREAENDGEHNKNQVERHDRLPV